ncbi:hypothetical protein Bbelb_161360 [Branchiostoma belcheri]|nr:hypothetical protein Bbelb_161360 [Branchiostoma belcheri]
MLDKATAEQREIYVLGDFNVDWIKSSDASKRLQDITQSYGVQQLVDKPTRTVNRGQSVVESCIDLVFTNQPDKCSKATIRTIGFSDHDAVMFSRKAKLQTTGPRTVHKRTYKDFNEETFHSDIKEAPWHLVYNFDDVNQATEMFSDILQDTCDRHAPIRKFTVRSSAAPWLTQDILELMEMRNEAKREAKTSGLESDWAVYRKLRNAVVSACRKAKTQFYRDTFEDCKGNPRKTWNTINALLGRKHTVSPTCVQEDGKLLSKPQDIAEHFAKFYEAKVAGLRAGMDYTGDGEIHSTPGQESFKLNPVTVKDVQKILARLPDGKAPGRDGIDNKLLRMCSDVIAEPLTYIVNLSFATGTFPAKWKHAKVVPLQKDNSKPLSGQNSRPVSLLPTCGKVCEILASDQIVSYFSGSSHQSEAQHAYRKCHSTETVLLKMTDEWLDNMDKGLMTSVVLLDYSAAFDLVDHTLLLKKLAVYGFSADALSWIQSYLSDRNWQVYANGAYSQTRVLQCGVPQGSCLGPQLYSIYVNDMAGTVENGELDQYADDSTVHTAGHTVQDIKAKALVDLECVAKWSDYNRLKLNNGKTKTMLVGTSRKTRLAPALQLELRGQSLEQVPTVKLLGVHVDQSLTFDDHIDHVVKKCNRCMAQVGRGLVTAGTRWRIPKMISHDPSRTSREDLAGYPQKDSHPSNTSSCAFHTQVTHPNNAETFHPEQLLQITSPQLQLHIQPPS